MNDLYRPPFSVIEALRRRLSQGGGLDPVQVMVDYFTTTPAQAEIMRRLCEQIAEQAVKRAKAGLPPIHPVHRQPVNAISGPQTATPRGVR